MNDMGHPLQHDAASLLAQARTATGIDIDDQAISERLTRFIDSLNREAVLSEAGARAIERGLLFLLGNRLRMERDFRQHPEIAEQAIVRPLIMTGGARTGSTKMHKMLAAGGDFRHVPSWQALSLAPLSEARDEDLALRTRATAEHLDWFNTHAPLARYSHEISTFETEEETFIQTHALYAPYIQAYVFIPSYLQWYATNIDPLDDIQLLKRGLQYLQWQFSRHETKPWILKSPAYLGLEPQLLKVFPDAAFLTTKRDPLAMFPSSVELLTNYQRAYSDVDRRRILGPVMLEGLASWAEYAVAARAAVPDHCVLDLAYDDIVRRAETVIEQIYAFHGMELTDRARRAMRDWDREHAQHKHGGPKPDLADFGLDEATVRARFAKLLQPREALPP